MPTYGYKCTQGHEYDLIEGFDAKLKHPCKVCGKVATRQVSAPAVHFKGDGWTQGSSQKLWDRSEGYEKVSDSVKERDSK